MLNKRNIILKIIMILIIFILVAYVSIPELSLAATNFSPNTYEPSSTNEVSDADELAVIGNKIIRPIETVGSIVSVGVLIVIGIRYMMASAEERAEYKKTMMPYIVGALMVFGITAFLEIIIEVSKIF